MKMGLRQTGYLEDVTEEEKLTVLTPEHLQMMLSYVKEMLESKILRDGVDYMTSSESGNRHLMKPGAEKIRIAFNLYDDQTPQDKTELPNKSFQYNHNHVKKRAKGFYSYTVKSVMIHKRTGEIFGSCLGSCNSQESGYEVVSPNTILKVAGKRATIGATINASGCSDLFAIDELVIKGNNTEKKKQPGRVKSKHGTKSNPWFCKVCKLKHITTDTWLVESYKHNGLVAEKCLKPDPNYEKYMKYTHKEILKKVTSIETDIHGDITVPDFKNHIMHDRKVAVNHLVLDLTKLEKNKKENLVRYLLVLMDKLNN